MVANDTPTPQPYTSTRVHVTVDIDGMTFGDLRYIVATTEHMSDTDDVDFEYDENDYGVVRAIRVV